MSNHELCDEIYKTIKMGKNATEALLSEVNHSGLRRTLHSQWNTYQNYGKRLASLQQPVNKQAPTPWMQKMLQYSAKMNARRDPSPNHIAKMMIKGSNMGVIDLQSALNHHPEAVPEAKQLASDIIDFQQNTINAYKQFL